MTCELLDAINGACEASISYGLPEQEVVSTGLPQLDAIMGGGVPLGRIMEIHGGESSGKTALALHMAQRLPGPTLYVDADHGLSPYLLQGAEDIYLLKVDTLETALDVLNQLTEGNRLVGIISHVGRLEESIPQKISVKNTGHGSLVTLD